MSDYAVIKKGLEDLEVTPTGVIIKQVGQYFLFAELIDRAHMLPKGVTVDGAVLAMIHGATVGLSPFPAVQGIAVINGRPTVWGDTMCAIVKASGLLENEKCDWVDGGGDKQGYKYTVWRKGVANPYSAVFTLAHAKRAGLLDKSGPWQTNPDRMTFVRARAFAYRNAFPDVLNGLACREEVEDEQWTERNITAEAKVAPSPVETVDAAEPDPAVEKKAEKRHADLMKKAKARAAQLATPEPTLIEVDAVPADKPRAAAIVCHSDGHADILTGEKAAALGKALEEGGKPAKKPAAPADKPKGDDVLPF